MLVRYCGPGLLGLGITALIAGFMSGMAGNVSAFSAVWTYDIYQPLINKNATDKHYVAVGRWATILGVVVSIGTAYLVCMRKASWITCRRCSASLSRRCWGRSSWACSGSGRPGAGGFWGLLAGTATSISLYIWVKLDHAALSIVAFSPDAKDMAENLYRALWSWVVCVLVTSSSAISAKRVRSASSRGWFTARPSFPMRDRFP